MTGRYARDQRRRLAVRVAQSVADWASPGMPVLAPGLDQALDHRGCPWAVTSGFAVAEETPWSQLCWSQDPDRWQEARASLRLATGVVQDLPLLAPRFGTVQGRGRLALLLSAKVAPHLPLDARTRMLLADLADSGDPWRATLGSVFARRILSAGLAELLELSFSSAPDGSTRWSPRTSATCGASPDPTSRSGSTRSPARTPRWRTG